MTETIPARHLAVGAQVLGAGEYGRVTEVQYLSDREAMSVTIVWPDGEATPSFVPTTYPFTVERS